MKISIVGAGRIGSALGRGWAQAGHDIMFGVRNPEDAELKQLIAELGGRPTVGSPQEAAAFGEVIVFAIPGAAMQETLARLGDLSGKILIDATNGLGNSTQAGAQMIAQWTPGASVFKAFNSIGFEILNVPMFGDLQADMFFCGDDTQAREVVAQLIADLAFRPMYVGDLSSAPMVEMLARLWGSLAYGQKMGRRLAFRMLTAEDET
jgi:8-hydroxy-5-deazaflavin:NADPH oxidoreductase